MIRKLVVAGLLAALACISRADAQRYIIGGPLPAVTTVSGCTQSGVTDYTNNCNNIYFLMGVLR
jgi:hypothetical protein